MTSHVRSIPDTVLDPRYHKRGVLFPYPFYSIVDIIPDYSRSGNPGGSPAEIRGYNRMDFFWLVCDDLVLL